MNWKTKTANRIRKYLIDHDDKLYALRTAEGYAVRIYEDGRIKFIDPETGAFVYPE